MGKKDKERRLKKEKKHAMTRGLYIIYNENFVFHGGGWRGVFLWYFIFFDVVEIRLQSLLFVV